MTCLAWRCFGPKKHKSDTLRKICEENLLRKFLHKFYRNFRTFARKRTSSAVISKDPRFAKTAVSNMMSFNVFCESVEKTFRNSSFCTNSLTSSTAFGKSSESLRFHFLKYNTNNIENIRTAFKVPKRVSNVWYSTPNVHNRSNIEKKLVEDSHDSTRFIMFFNVSTNKRLLAASSKFSLLQFL